MFQFSKDLIPSALSLIEGESNQVANLANLSSLIYHSMDNLNWVGFYLWDKQQKNLVLGPFQGKPACIRITPERGVCGRAYTTRSIQVIPDVSKFEGHIACDSDSKSELVIPIVVSDQCVGVLDLDSPLLNRFHKSDADLMFELVEKTKLRIWKDF